jgi:hypothetical protein
MNTRAKTVPAVMLEVPLSSTCSGLRCGKVDATDLMDLMPDLAKTMATMAANHLGEPDISGQSLLGGTPD